MWAAGAAWRTGGWCSRMLGCWSGGRGTTRWAARGGPAECAGGVHMLSTWVLAEDLLGKHLIIRARPSRPGQVPPVRSSYFCGCIALHVLPPPPPMPNPAGSGPARRWLSGGSCPPLRPSCGLWKTLSGLRWSGQTAPRLPPTSPRPGRGPSQGQPGCLSCHGNPSTFPSKSACTLLVVRPWSARPARPLPQGRRLGLSSPFCCQRSEAGSEAPSSSQRCPTPPRAAGMRCWQRCWMPRRPPRGGPSPCCASPPPQGT